MTSEKVIWLEDESQRIGEVNIPTIFFKQMREKKVLFLDIPFDERLQYILQGYGKFSKEHLVNAVIRIKKRLGGLETKTAINCLIEDDIMGCFAILLKYYDKGYFAGSLTQEEVIGDWISEEVKYAKRQMVWFKKDSRINWFDTNKSRWQEKVEFEVQKWYS